VIYQQTDNYERLCKELRKVKPLTNEEQLALFIQYKENPTKELESILFNYNLRLVLTFSNKFYQLHNTKEDLISIGGIGLIKAIRNYDPTKGFTFSSFAKPYINNEIYDDFRYNESTIRKKSSVIRDIKAGKIKEVNYISTSTTLGDTSEDTIGDTLTYNNHNFDDLITEPTTFEKETEFWDYVKSILPKEKYYDIVKAVFSANTKQAGVIKITESTISEMYGVSKQAIGQMKRKAFKILAKDEKFKQYWKQNIFNDTD